LIVSLPGNFTGREWQQMNKSIVTPALELNSGQRTSPGAEFWNSTLSGTIYVMAPMTMYYKKSLAKRKLLLQRILPEAELIYPDGLFLNSFDWLERIDDIVADCDSGILLSEKNLIIGKGCFFETDLLKRSGKPVLYLDYVEKTLTHEFTLAKLPGDDWTYYALVELSNVRGRSEFGKMA